MGTRTMRMGTHSWNEKSSGPMLSEVSTELNIQNGRITGHSVCCFLTFGELLRCLHMAPQKSSLGGMISHVAFNSS